MNRRGFLRGAGALLAAPAIVRVASLMPVSAALVEPPPIVLLRELPVGISIEEFAERYLGPAVEHMRRAIAHDFMTANTYGDDFRFFTGEQWPQSTH